MKVYVISEVIKKYALDYQRSKDPKLYGAVVKRLEPLISYVLEKHMRRTFKPDFLDLQDYYHACIVGVGRAISTVKENELPDRVIARMVSYMRLELNILTNSYRVEWKRRHPIDALGGAASRPDPQLAYIEAQDLLKHLSDDELVYIHERYYQGKTLIEMAQEKGVSEWNQWSQGQTILHHLRTLSGVHVRR